MNIRPVVIDTNCDSHFDALKHTPFPIVSVMTMDEFMKRNLLWPRIARIQRIILWIAKIREKAKKYEKDIAGAISR